MDCVNSTTAESGPCLNRALRERGPVLFMRFKGFESAMRLAESHVGNISPASCVASLAGKNAAASCHASLTAPKIFISFGVFLSLFLYCLGMNLGYFFDNTAPDGMDRVVAQIGNNWVNNQHAGELISILSWPRRRMTSHQTAARKI
jgi:hypothetical protein